MNHMLSPSTDVAVDDRVDGVPASTWRSPTETGAPRVVPTRMLPGGARQISLTWERQAPSDQVVQC